MADRPKPTKTLDDNTRASNPGRLRVDYLYWLRSFPYEPAALIIPLVILTGLAFSTTCVFLWAFSDIFRTGKGWSSLPSGLFGIAVMDSIIFFLGIAPLRDRLLFLINHIREQFLYGCVNPGIVVSTNPPLVAVCTDLSTGKIQHHVIKILPQPLRWLKNGLPPVGTKLASVALYEGSLHKDAWEDFHPIVVDCVTGNRADIERVFQSISEVEWQTLEVGISYLRTKKPGLYSLPYLHCEFCHHLTFLPLYWIHEQQHIKLLPDGQRTNHITIEPEHHYQGLLDRVPQVYFHPGCGTVTKMPEDIIRSYLVNPFLYNEYTYCYGCSDYVLQDQLYWQETGQCLADYFQELQQEYIRIHGEPPY